MSPVLVAVVTVALVWCGALAGSELGAWIAYARFRGPREPAAGRTFIPPPVAAYLMSAPRRDEDWWKPLSVLWYGMLEL